MRFVMGSAAAVVLALALYACGGSSTAPSSTSSCTAGPYTFDSNPSVNRCRASNGQFADNACCGR
jgi:hypothetical protein